MRDLYLREYFKSLCEGYLFVWGGMMSVALGIFGVTLSVEWQRILVWSAAGICAIIAPYAAWLAEHKKAIKSSDPLLEERYAEIRSAMAEMYDDEFQFLKRWVLGDRRMPSATSPNNPDNASVHGILNKAKSFIRAEQESGDAYRIRFIIDEPMRRVLERFFSDNPNPLNRVRPAKNAPAILPTAEPPGVVLGNPGENLPPPLNDASA